MEKNKGGRPYKEIDKMEFEKLCGLQCREDEICGFFDCCEDTLNAWCKRTYGEGFSEVFSKKRGKGKIALRRNQFQLSRTNANMAIFLGKQYLEQSDSAAYNVTVKDIQDDPLTAALREEAERMEENGKDEENTDD